MSDTKHAPVLEIGYYHPSETFRRMSEHISVMDTSKPVPGGDGELIALFGPSQCSGATEEEAAESRKQAQLFIAAQELLEACEAFIAFEDEADLSDYLRRANVVSNGIRAAVAKAKGMEP